jgi:hypothetical protein
MVLGALGAMMKNPSTIEVLLSVIAVSLLAMATRSYLSPPAVRADASPYPFYIEPGTQMLRAPDGSKQVYGRVVVDMRNGRVWGFPTTTTDVYPTNAMETKPQVSHPFELGRFAFEDAEK